MRKYLFLFSLLPVLGAMELTPLVPMTVNNGTFTILWPGAVVVGQVPLVTITAMAGDSAGSWTGFYTETASVPLNPTEFYQVTITGNSNKFVVTVNGDLVGNATCTGLLYQTPTTTEEGGVGYLIFSAPVAGVCRATLTNTSSGYVTVTEVRLQAYLATHTFGPLAYNMGEAPGSIPAPALLGLAALLFRRLRRA